VKSRIAGLSFLLAAASLPLTAQPHSTAIPGNDEIRDILANRVDVQHQAVGIVAGVIDPEGSRIVSYGRRNQNDALPLDGDTEFEIGSITKIFTALLLTEMAQDGEVTLDDPVAKFLPRGVTVPERNGRAITLEDLATHTSGLPRTPVNLRPKDPSDPFADYSAQQLYEFLAAYQLPRDIGSEWEYSNLGSGLLGLALGLRERLDYGALVQTRIAQPLAMTSTHIRFRDSEKARLAIGHNSRLAPVGNWSFDALAGAGALHSSANDMLKFLAAVLGYTKSQLAPAMAAMLDVRRPTGTPGLDNALGWQVSTPDAVKIIWKDGRTLGYSSFLGYNPVSHIGVVVLSNTATARGVNDIGMYILVSKSRLFRPLAKPKPRAIE
jgi:CubicO group peptidase (beta-lactamase class C family)